MTGLLIRIQTSGKLASLAICSIAPLVLAVLAATPCLAQFGGGGLGAGSPASAAKHGGAAAKPEPAAPPVLPGTKSASEPAAPTRLTADMSPTDALFDAINRGDLTSARDAVNRGANLDGQNLLGLTPLDLSVDLGRNEISFMLLSMRGEDPTPHRAGRGDAVRHEGTPAKIVSRQRVIAASAAEPADERATGPRFYSGNGGAPIPAAGFVGFDGGRSVR